MFFLNAVRPLTKIIASQHAYDEIPSDEVARRVCTHLMLVPDGITKSYTAALLVVTLFSKLIHSIGQLNVHFARQVFVGST